MALEKIFNISDKLEIKKLNKMVDKIDLLEEKMSSLSDTELKSMTQVFKNRLKNGETLDDILFEAFAVVREASKRVLGMRQYRVQLIGGIVIHQGKIAEMRTGEGKTLVGVAPVYLNALEGKGVHVVTVNDYLAKRDKEIMEPIYNFLGLSVGVIIHGQDTDERRAQYNCDITYGTNNEFGFDYLKDNMIINKDDSVQNELNFAIIDEIDSILIDEARTPLIISGEIPQDNNIYYLVNVFMKMLLKGDINKDEKEKTITLTDIGIKKAEQFFRVDNLFDTKNTELYHHINQALRAYGLMRRDVDYVVKDNEVMIVDEFTGRIMEGRRFSEGLHQAIEAKENVEIKNESKTLATITFQNYFKMYNKLSGMTGTAKTEETEFGSIYNMNVVQIPTHREVIRRDLSDKIYKTEKLKFEAVVETIERIHITGQPILVGTTSVEKSELLSYLLTKKGLKHKVLNAKNHEEEANIVSKAGTIGAITISTNMAGRGTDISLGGGDKDEEEKIKKLGGLYVIGTERHESRRIDNQLRGRSGRQGDPGTSRFYLSLEDEIMKLYGSKKVNKKSEKIKDETKPIEDKYIVNSVDKSQQLLEFKNFGIRKNVVQYDNVVNEQRKAIYRDRNSILNEENISLIMIEMIKWAINDAFEQFKDDLNKYMDYINRLFKINKHNIKIDIENISKNKIANHTIEKIVAMYNLKSTDKLHSMEKIILLQVIDKYWIEYIDQLEQLKQSINLVAIGQKDPVKEFTNETFDMLEDISRSIKLDTINYIFESILE